jgi:hypothetical protein
MKKILITTLLFSHFSILATDDGSDKIIKKYLKAIGGAKEWEKIKTLQIIRHQDNKDYELLEQVSILRERGIRYESISTGTPNITSFFEGKCWSVINPQKIELKSRDTLDIGLLFKNDSSNVYVQTNGSKCDARLGLGRRQIADIEDGINHYFHFHFFNWQIQMPWNFLDYEAKGYKAVYKGDSKMSIDDVSEVEMVSNTGDTARYFFDKRTSLLSKAIHKNIQLDFSSYKKIGKVILPHEVQKTITDFRFMKEAPITPHSDWYTIDQVKLNEPIDEKIFMKPKQ